MCGFDNDERPSFSFPVGLNERSERNRHPQLNHLTVLCFIV